MKTYSIGIFGAGSLGMLIGAYLSKEHSVTLYGRSSHMQAAKEQGIRVSGVNGERIYRVNALSDPSQLQGLVFDLAIIGAKAYGTNQILHELEGRVSFRWIASLQNGLKDEELISKFGLERVLGCVVDESVKPLGVGHVYYANKNVSCFGKFKEESGREKLDLAESLASTLEDQTIQTKLSNDMRRLTWYKFMIAVPGMGVNGMLNYTSAQTYTNPFALDMFLETAREIREIAGAEGITLEEHPLLNKIFLMGSKEEQKEFLASFGEQILLRPEQPIVSLVQDLRKGKTQTEADAVIGKASELAGKYRLPAETIRMCYKAIKAREWENNRKTAVK